VFVLNYYFNGHIRQQYGFGHPGIAAIMLGVLLCVLWYAQSVKFSWNVRTGIKYLTALGVLEAVVWTGVASTYTRWPTLCIMAAGIMGSFALRPPAMTLKNQRSLVVEVGVRILVIGLIFVAVGFVQRVTPDYIAQDRSVINRFSIWKYGCTMLTDAPFSGWRTPPGFILDQWYNVGDSPFILHGLSNGFLTIGNIYGVWLLYVASAVILFTFAGTWTTYPHVEASERAKWICALRIAFIIIGSNLAGDYILDVRVAGLLAAILSCLFVRMGIVAIRSCVAGRLLVRLAYCSTLAAVGLVCFRYVSPKGEWRVAGWKGHYVVGHGDSSAPRNLVLPDCRVLGRIYGPFLRKIFEASGGFLVEEQMLEGRAKGEFSNVYAFGGRFREIDERVLKSARLVVVHPIGFPEMLKVRPSAVVLPEVDQSMGGDEKWSKWARDNRIRLMISPQCAQKIKLDETVTWWRAMDNI